MNNNMAVQRSRQYIVLQRNRPLLASKGEECLQELTVAAFDGGLISDETSRECGDETVSTEDRAQTLADTLLEKVGEEEAYFDILVTVLRRIPTVSSIGDRLEHECRTEIGGFSVPPSSGGGAGHGFGERGGGEDRGKSTRHQDATEEGDSGLGTLSNTNLHSESPPSTLVENPAAFGKSQLLDAPLAQDTGNGHPNGDLVSHVELPQPLSSEHRSLPQQATDGSPPSDHKSQAVMPSRSESLNTKFMNLAAELSEKEVELDSLKADFDNVSQEKELLETDVKTAKKQMERMEVRRASEAERLEGDIERLNGEIGEKDKQLDNLRERISQVEAERNQLKDEQEKLSGKTRDMEVRLRKQKEEHEEENLVHKQETDKLKRERDQLRHEKDNLACILDQLECHDIFTYKLLYCVIAFFVVLIVLLAYADLYGRFSH